jgi:hypothetical protein
MIRLDGWIAIFSATSLLWYECREDLAVFCYRISCGAVAAVRLRALDLAPVQAIIRTSGRNNVACSNPSFTFSARSTILKDSKS